jgi:hypothetical protein
VIAKREACRVLLNDLGKLVALLPSKMHDDSCSLQVQFLDIFKAMQFAHYAISFLTDSIDQTSSVEGFCPRSLLALSRADQTIKAVRDRVCDWVGPGAAWARSGNRAADLNPLAVCQSVPRLHVILAACLAFPC